MSEVGFRIYTSVFFAGAEFYYAFSFALFLKPFMAGGRTGRKLLFVFLLYLVCISGCHLCGAPPGISGMLLLLMLLTVPGAAGLERNMAFLLTLLYWNVRISGGLMMESLFFLTERFQAFGVADPRIIYVRTAVLVSLFLIFHGALVALMLYMLQRLLKKGRFTISRQELCYDGLIPAAGILFGQMMSGLLFEIKDGSWPGLYERHPVFLAAIPLMALLFYAGTFLTILSRQEMARLREDEAAGFVERQQEKAIRTRLQETEQFYTQVRQMKHEMRGHMANVKGLAQSGRYADLEAYIARMDGEIKDLKLEIQTGNPVTDVIINDKRQQCREAGISFQTDFYYPEGRNYQAFDVGIVLQNLLQNALEAAGRVPEGERFIAVSGTRRGRFFLIEVKNTSVKEVMFGPDGLPVTTKREDVFMHGIGLSNVRRTAEKYMGELELKAEEGIFYATVLLQEGSSYE